MFLTIKTATAEDISDLAKIHIEGWQGAYSGILDQNYIDSQNIEKRTKDWQEWMKEEGVTRLLAYKDNVPVGFIAFGALRTPPAGMSKIRPLYSSEIYGLYLIPEVFRQGIGTTIFKKAVKNLQIQKHQSMCLWVLDKNKRACTFYEKMGGQRVGKKMVEFGPTKAKEVCYAWRDFSAFI